MISISAENIPKISLYSNFQFFFYNIVLFGGYLKPKKQKQVSIRPGLKLPVVVGEGLIGWSAG